MVEFINNTKRVDEKQGGSDESALLQDRLSNKTIVHELRAEYIVQPLVARMYLPLDRFESLPVFQGISPREGYDRAGFGQENSKGLSGKDIVDLASRAVARLRRN